MNPAYLSALSALAGSLIGALASFSTTWLTQHFQIRTQRRQQEMSRREKLYGDFIDEASRLFADALTHSLEDPSKLVSLYAILGKLRLFASSKTMEVAEDVMSRIVTVYYRPPEDFQGQATIESHSLDVLRDFTEACRADLRG